MHEEIESRFQTLLQGLAGTFATPDQVTRGDWRVLDRGASPVGILYPGTVTEDGPIAAGATQYTWEVNLLLAVRDLADGASMGDLIKARDAVIAHLQKYPSLDALAGVQGVSRFSGGEIGDIRDKDTDVSYFLQTVLTWQVTSIETVSGGEIA